MEKEKKIKKQKQKQKRQTFGLFGLLSGLFYTFPSPTYLVFHAFH